MYYRPRIVDVYKIQNLEIQDMDNKIILLLMSYCVGCRSYTYNLFWTLYYFIQQT